MATLVAYEDASPAADAELLRNACHGWGTDEKAVISILGHRNAIQRKLIREAYQEIYEEDLVKLLEDELYGDFERAVYRWNLDPADRNAVLANVALRKENVYVIIELSCTLSPEELFSVKHAYQCRYKRSLEEDIASHTSCDLRKSIGSLQKKYKVGAFELLSKTAHIQAISLLVLGPFIDYYLSGNLISDYIRSISSGAIVFILLSCSLAVFCNITQYLCIGRFSAVSFQVLGHMKTVCVLTLGWVLSNSQLTLKNILGMLVAIAGMVIYSWAVEAEKASSKVTTTHTKHSLIEEELNLLKEGDEKKEEVKPEENNSEEEKPPAEEKKE